MAVEGLPLRHTGFGPLAVMAYQYLAVRTTKRSAAATKVQVKEDDATFLAAFEDTDKEGKAVEIALIGLTQKLSLVGLPIGHSLTLGPPARPGVMVML